MQLNGLSALDSAILANEPYRRLGYQMSAMKAAFSSGLPRSLPIQTSFPTRSTGSWGRQRRRRWHRGSLLGNASATAVPNRGGTSCLLLADAKGNAICMVQSIFAVFGSAFLDDPSTGILFNNRMSGIYHHPDRANSVAPGKPPGAHTMPGSRPARWPGAVRLGEPGRHQPNPHQCSGHHSIA